MPRRPSQQHPRRRAPWAHPAAFLVTCLALGLQWSGAAAAQSLDLAWVLPERSLYAGETFELTLEVTYEAPEEGGLVQLFPQALGLPVQLEAFGSVSGLDVLPAPLGDAGPAGDGAPEGDGTSLVLDGEVVRAPDLDPSAPTTRLRITRAARARRPGTIRLPELVGRYAVSSGFRSDLVRGDVPIDREDRLSRGAPRDLAVLPLPDSRAPIDYGGAVGPLVATGRLDRNRAVVGDTLRLEVEFTGGWLNDGKARPTLAPVEGLELTGSTTGSLEGSGGAGRSFRFDLLVTSSAPVATPAVTLTTFDPTADPPGFREAALAPLPISVRAPSREAVEPAPEPQDGAPAEGKPPLVWTPAVLAFMVLLAAVMLRRQRRDGGGGPP